MPFNPKVSGMGGDRLLRRSLLVWSFGCLLLVGGLTYLVFPQSPEGVSCEAPSPSYTKSKDTFYKIPTCSILENKGQENSDALYILKTPTLNVEFMESQIAYRVFGSNISYAEIQIKFIGSNKVMPRGIGASSGTYNFLITNNSEYWITNVKSFSAIIYEEIYPNIDLIYYLNNSQVKYDFVIHPGGEPRKIKIEYKGVIPIIIQNKLYFYTKCYVMYENKPYAFLKDTGRPVDVSWKKVDPHIITFEIGEYDPNKELIIDPLIYSTYVGGISDDRINHAFLKNDVLYVTGFAKSYDFPTTNGSYSRSNNGGFDVFVMAMNITTMQMIYCTYIGGYWDDYGIALTVDESYNAYVTGYTYSSNFPTTTNAYDRTFNGGSGYLDAFVLKLNKTGSNLILSTYLGGSNHDYGTEVKINNTGYIFVSGYTFSTDFPTTTGAFSSSLSGSSDGYITIFNPSGSQLMASTFFGGSMAEITYGLVLDENNETVYVGGVTASSNFPLIRGYDSTYNGGSFDVFIAILPYNLSRIDASTLFGGNGLDSCVDLLFDSKGRLYSIGSTTSTNIPTTAKSYDTTYNGNKDALIIIFNHNLSSLRYSTYIGGSGEESGERIYIDEQGILYVAGKTGSWNFPVVPGSYSTTLNASTDGYLIRLDINTSKILYGTYLGGSGEDYCMGLGVDIQGYAYLGGPTASSSFPTTSNALSTRYGGGLYDGFLTKLYPHLPGPVENLTCENQNYSVRLRWTPPRDTGGVPIDGYIIYRGASPGALTEFRRVGNVTEFVDGYYDMRRTYYYRVRAYTIGGMGGLSPVANGTPYTPPREPQGLTGDVNGANVTLTWQEPLDDGGWPVTHYRIYRSSDNVYFTYVGSTRGTNFTETGLPPGRSYYYYVTAVNYVGEGRKSNILAIYLYTYPSEPVDLKVVPLEGKIMISWLPPHFDGGTPVMSYRVYRSAGTSPFELYEEVPVGTRILYDRNVSYGVRYFYYVTAVNAYGEGGRSDIGSAIPGKIPSPVTDLRAVPERDRVTLLWSEPVDISGYEILDYYLYRSVNGGGMELVAVVQGTVWVDVDVRLGYTYRYGIEARNIWGLSERSLSGEIVIGEAPGEVSYFSIAGGKKAVYLSWDEPENTGGVPVKGYIIYKGVLGGELELYLTLPPDETGYTDSDVIPGVRYVYAVCAYNEFGEGRRVYGEAIPYTFPDPPRDFRGEAGDGWVELSWEEPLFDGGRPIEGYMIYWQASGELEWRIEIVGPEVRAYHIGGLTNGLVYRFSIRSFTSVAESELTEIIELKPSSVPQAPGSISATYEVGGVLIVWSQPGDTGGSEIKGYRIYRSVGGGELELLVELGPTAFRYRDDKVLKGEVYAYAVAAFSDVGEGRRSRVVSVFPATPPGVVKGFTAIGMGMDHVDLFWEGVDDSGGYPLTGYVIYRGLSPANMVKLIELPAGSRSFSDTTVEAGKEYYYIIRAENALGEGEQSDYLSVEVKGVPGDVKDFSVKYSKKDKAVLLTWSGVENDGGSEVTGYIIYRGEEGGAVREYAMVDGDARMYVDRDVKDGVRYTYRIRAVNAEGVGSAVERSVYVPSKLWQFFVMGLLGLIPILGLYLFDYIKKRGRGKKAAEEPTAKGPEGLTPPWSPPAAVVRKPPLPPPQHSPPSEGGKEETEVKYIPPQEGG